MKLILQIAAGVVIGGIAMMGIQALLAYSTLAAVTSALPRATIPQVPPVPERSYPRPPITYNDPTTNMRVDTSPPKIEMIRKATPEDAKAKPLN
jgi:hypothetical protein